MDDGRRGIRAVADGAAALALTVVLQAAGLPQLVTGTAVNAVYVLLLLRSGTRAALLLCVATPLAALLTGHLPPPLLLLLPAIVLGNAALVLTRHGLEGRSLLLRVAVPALAKAAAVALGALVAWALLGLPPSTQALALPVVGLQWLTAGAGLFLAEALRTRVSGCAP